MLLSCGTCLLHFGVKALRKSGQTSLAIIHTCLVHLSAGRQGSAAGLMHPCSFEVSQLQHMPCTQQAPEVLSHPSVIMIIGSG